MKLSKKIKHAILEHRDACLPHECCGLIVGSVYVPCDNIAPQGFEICPKSYVKAARQGAIRAIVHSHPDGDCMPSDMDKAQMRLHGVPWVIVGQNDEFGIYEADGEND